MSYNQLTPEMIKYNELAKDYEGFILAGSNYECLKIAEKVQEYLKTLPHKTRMYGYSDKWTTAGELAEYNKTRIENLKRKVFSLELGGAHRRK